MESLGLTPETPALPGTAVHVAIGGKYAGYILIADALKEDAAEAIAGLASAGVRKTVMLTGDSLQTAAQVAGELGLQEYHGELMPGDKAHWIEQLQGELSRGRTLVFVGDGINDAPVLAQADVGVAMGGLGSDAAIEAADIVIMDDRPSKLPLAISIARNTLAIVKQNIIFALGIKGLVLILGACGIATMWEAVFADVGVSVIAILNSMRALRQKD